MLGILAFILALLVLVLVHEYGHFQAARSFGVAVEEFGFGFPPAAISKKIGQTIYSLNWLPLGGFVRIKGEEETSKDFDSFSAQSVWRRAVIIAAGIFMNLVLAAFLFSVGYIIGVPQELDSSVPSGAIVRNVQHNVVDILPQSPAAKELQVGDQIISLDGQTFATRVSLQTYIRSHTAAPIAIAFLRNTERRVVLLQPQDIAVSPSEHLLGLGVSLDTIGTVSYPVYRAPLEGIITTGKMIGMIAVTLWQLAGNLVHHESAAVAVSGPIGIAVISGEVAHSGVLAYLEFLAILSVNLAFVNCLPFPGLDGGRLLFIGIEAVRRRPVTARVEGTIHRFGFVVLLCIVVLVTVMDLNRYQDIFVGWWNTLRHFVI